MNTINDKNLYWLVPIGLLIVIAAMISSLSMNDDYDFIIEDFKVYEYNKIQNDWDNVPFEPSTYNDLEFRGDTIKLVFKLSETDILSKSSLLEFTSPAMSVCSLSASFPNSQNTSAENRLEDISKRKSIFYPNPVFQLPSNASLVEEYELKFFSDEQIKFTLALYNYENFLTKYSKILISVIFYAGIMAALFIYNFILYFIVRDKVYLYYSLYISLISGAQLSLLGFSYYLFFNQNKELYEISIIGFSCLSGIFGVLFLKSFLKTNEFIPKVDKLLTGLVLVYVLGVITRLIGWVPLSYRLTDVGGILVVVLFVTSGVMVIRKGYRPASYFMIAWSFFLIGLMLFILHNLGFINLGTFPNLPMLVGTALEAVLLSLALAYRINALKKEKEDEQVEKLEILRQNELLILRQNEMLEEKVKMRTEELEETLHDLQNTQIQLVNQEKMASLGQLTAGIAHEINNPINFVSSNINPLKRDINDVLEIVEAYRESGLKEFSEETKKKLLTLEDDLEFEYVLQEIEQLLRGMEDGAKRTVEIVKGLRLFSRVDEQDVKKVNIHDGIDSTIVLLNSTMAGKIKIIKEYGDLPLVECLAGKMNQVFMNIITNSIHALQDNFEKEKEPTITIKTSSDGERARLEIKDNGPGIPENVKQRIFEPFFTTKSVGKGTGLGLSIVYTIIENHKGGLEVNSEEGKGTSFIITLPIVQINQDER